MSFYIQKSIFQNQSSIQDILINQGFYKQDQTQSHYTFKIKLDEIQTSRINTQYSRFCMSVIFKLLQEYLTQSGGIQNIYELTSSSFSEEQIKRFIKFIKNKHTEYQKLYHLQQVLDSNHIQSDIIMQKIRFCSQSKQLIQNLHILKDKQKQLVSLNNKMINIDSKKLQVFDTLLYNSQLRYNTIHSQKQHKEDKQTITFRKTKPSSKQGLIQQLALLKQKEELMRKIVLNGGWGLLDKIRAKVSQLKTK